MKLLRPLALSLVIHLFLALGLLNFHFFFPKHLEKMSSLTELEVIESSKPTSVRNFVRAPEVPQPLKQPITPDPKAFLSDKDQRVTQQMLAKKTGLTQNASNSKSDPQNLSLNELASSESMFGHSLPTPIEFGNITALNTDRFMFSSFFNRLEQLIRYRWESEVRAAFRRFPASAFQDPRINTWTTNVELVLSPSGEYLQTILLKSAGAPGLDLAVEAAFSEARFFPNPPRVLIGEDQTIRIRLSFQVRNDPTLLARPY